MKEPTGFKAVIICIVYSVFLSTASYEVGQRNFQKEVEDAFTALEEKNGSDHPVAKCMKQHFQNKFPNRKDAPK